MNMTETAKQNLLWSGLVVFATLIGVWFRSDGFVSWGVDLLYVYVDAAVLSFGIVLVSMISGWLLFPPLIWFAKDNLNQKTEASDLGNGIDVYILIYVVVAAVLVFSDTVGR